MVGVHGCFWLARIRVNAAAPAEGEGNALQGETGEPASESPEYIADEAVGLLQARLQSPLTSP